MAKIEYIFYVTGIIFLFATVIYFAYENIANLSDKVKTILLICLIFIFFFAAEFMQRRGI